MKTKPIKTKLLAIMLTLFMVFSLVPISAFAESGAYTVCFYPGDYGTMTKDDQIPFVYYNIDDEVNKPFYYKLNVSETDTLSFASSIINVLLPNSGYEFAYWTADATVYQVGSDTAIPAGTALSSDQVQNGVNVRSDVTFTAHFKQISEYPDDSVITAVEITGATLSYKAGDKPKATAQVAVADADKYEIAYETWQQFENNEPVAAWYSDNGSHGSLPTITEFESGKRYVYSVWLKPKDGYSFSKETTMTVNGESVLTIYVDGQLYAPATKTITPTKQNSTITSAAVDNVKLDYKPGDAPQATVQVATADQDKYDIFYESWGKQEKTDESTIETVAYWYSDESRYQDGDVRLTAFDKDGMYQYNVRLKAKDGFTFSDSISAENITLNGKSLPEGSYVIVLDEGKTCLVTYGMTVRTVQPVEEIRFDGPAIDAISGDAPKFTGYVNSTYYDVGYQKWEDKDNRNIGVNSDESKNGSYDQVITSFEYGKTYIYGVSFNIADLGLELGYRFDENTKLYINDNEISLNSNQVEVSDDGMSIQFKDVLSMTPEAPWQKINVVEIEGATVNFKDGDKPTFTGKTPENAPYIYQFECWETKDGAGVNSAKFFDDAYEKHITAFKGGETYQYILYLKAEHGYYFTADTKIKINGTLYSYRLVNVDPDYDSSGRMYTFWAYTDLTMTPQASTTHSHSYGTEWKSDETNHWHECACGDTADKAAHTFKWVTDKEATATEKGSKHEECTICDYKKAAVEIPATGSATKPTDQTNKSGNTSSPQTGDNRNLALWFAVLFISGGVAVGTATVSRKKENKR